MKQFLLTYPEDKILALDCFCKKSRITRSMFFRNLLDDRIKKNNFDVTKITDTIKNLMQ